MIIVRSQNKEVLVEAKALAVDNYEGTWYVGQEANSKELFNLGEYSTKEKAIAVLDLIGKHIEQHPGLIFEMPQDSEVKNV